MNVTAPTPTVELEFHTDPHPDPIVQALIAKVERLQAEVRHLQAKLALLEPIGG